MGLHLSGIVAAISVLPATLTILLRHKLPLPLTLTFGHISLVGFAVALATTDQFAAHSTQLLGKVYPSWLDRPRSFVLLSQAEISMLPANVAMSLLVLLRCCHSVLASPCPCVSDPFAALY